MLLLVFNTLNLIVLRLVHSISTHLGQTLALVLHSILLAFCTGDIRQVLSLINGKKQVFRKFTKRCQQLSEKLFVTKFVQNHFPKVFC